MKNFSRFDLVLTTPSDSSKVFQLVVPLHKYAVQAKYVGIPGISMQLLIMLSGTYNVHLIRYYEDI